ncbi:UDP-N-acetylmuramyl tripeptide synthase [Duganella sp. 1411]|uniref:Mur ligase family protein n=1 Tax=Duganella sp. 1411 TaxID=2806572 RepID=UPI001AE7B7BC|nr:Mur ligase family protein [Duganella sp. 1411]MBP1204769.1 UDP-N-acetylmuramyl tripeptide synthase [Duganella sp. 1411]
MRQRLLRGANLYSPHPCLAATIAFDDDGAVPPADAAAALGRQLGAPLPPAAGADIGQLVAQVALMLQRSCGHALDFAHSEPLAPGAAQRRVVIQYALEHVAQRALATALDMVGAAMRGDDYDAPAALAALHALSLALALPPRIAELAGRARALGIPVLRASEHADLVQFGWGSRQWRFVDAPLADTRLLTNTIVRDRLLTRALMVEANIDVPAGTTVGRLEDALRVGRRYDWQVVVKRRHVGGDERQWRCAGEAELTAAFALAHAGGGDVVLESFEDGPLAVVAVDAGGARHASAPVRRLCEGAAAKLGLAEARVGVVDTRLGPLVTALGGAADAGVLDAAERERLLLAEPDQGRIPLIAVTGTNGKTTTTLMIAHAVRLAGLRTGTTTTQGIFIDERIVGQGDCTGYWSHRAVLGSPEVDFAVLETARGGLLKRGLAFDACAVGVMLNVSDDHLGLDGVETVDDLARVKSTVVAVARTAVLNADDRHCVAALARLAPGAAAILFSMDAANPALRGHLARGGASVWLEDEAIMLADGAAARPVIGAAAIPATVGGLARYNVANSLAATAALHAAGFDPAHIGAALSTFVSDAATNPLRSNIFAVRDFHIVLDYAHNPAAYAALGAMARGMAARVPGARAMGVVTSPGDRRDADLRRIGETCAAAFDTLFVYESLSRGRPRGEAAAVIADGVRAAGGPGHLDTFGGAAEAVQAAYRLCGHGDVLVFACGTAVSTLIEAVRAIDPDGAAALERQAAGEGSGQGGV